MQLKWMQKFSQTEEPVKCLALIFITFLYIYTQTQKQNTMAQNTIAPSTRKTHNCSYYKKHGVAESNKRKPKKNVVPAKEKKETIAIVRSMNCQMLQK